MKICLDKSVFDKLSLDELKKILNILINMEDFENSSVLRDIINKRIEQYNIINGSDDDDVELQ
jgi:protein-arginine kinase activator protein McsA